MLDHTIAFYIPNLDGGGAERVMINLANGIAERGNFKVDFVVAVKQGPLLGDISNKVNLIDLGSKRIATSLLPLTAYIRKTQPDILLSALGTANIISILAKKLSFNQITLIITEHSTMSVAARNPTNWRARLMPRLISKLYPCADGIVAVSSGVADDLATVSQIDRHKIEVIYNPVITPEVRNLSQESCTDEWITDPLTPTVVSIGRLSPEKDFANLLEAIAIVVKHRPVKLIILGEGNQRKYLEDLTAELKLTEYVKMPGFVKNPYSYLRKAQLFVLSSLLEGLPTALIEGLFCNTKLVSTDCPNGPREILDNGRYGVLVKPNDPTDLAHGILEALKNKTITVPDESWERYTLEYSIEHYISYMLNKTQDKTVKADV